MAQNYILFDHTDSNMQVADMGALRAFHEAATTLAGAGASHGAGHHAAAIQSALSAEPTIPGGYGVR